MARKFNIKRTWYCVFEIVFVAGEAADYFAVAAMRVMAMAMMTVTMAVTMAMLLVFLVFLVMFVVFVLFIFLVFFLLLCAMFCSLADLCQVRRTVLSPYFSCFLDPSGRLLALR